jgi:hypothetical protein
MRQRRYQRKQGAQKESPDFLSLKTLKDTSNVAKQYAFIRRAVRDLKKAHEKLKQYQAIEGRDSDVVLEFLTRKADQIHTRTQVAIAVLLKMRKKIENFAKKL